MNKLLLVTAVLLVLYRDVSAGENPDDYTKATSVYDFTVKDIKGNDVSLDKYKGNVLLIVNVASNCGLTEKNYQQLNQLYDKFESKGLKILAFPCNQFLQQEPGTNDEIATFAEQHGVKFDMFSKIDVNGEEAHPLYKFLKFKQPQSEKEGGDIEWNFVKFIVDKNGQVVERHVPKQDPIDLIPNIEKYL